MNLYPQIKLNFSSVARLLAICVLLSSVILGMLPGLQAQDVVPESYPGQDVIKSEEDGEASENGEIDEENGIVDDMETNEIEQGDEDEENQENEVTVENTVINAEVTNSETPESRLQLTQLESTLGDKPKFKLLDTQIDGFEDGVILPDEIVKFELAKQILAETNESDFVIENVTTNFLEVRLDGKIISNKDYYFEAGSIVLVLNPELIDGPGEYEIGVTYTNPENGTKEDFTQDFSWGVLALNSDKDVYKINETAKFHMGVLDPKGFPTCNAKVSLTIEDQNGNISAKPEVKKSEFCDIFDSTTTVGDFLADFTFKSAGEYKVKMTADYGRGERHMLRTVSVSEEPSIQISREAATRLYPKGVSPMTITVKFSQDFVGEVTERLPSNFEIVEINQDGALFTYKNEHKITWPVSGAKGEEITLTYKYDAPDFSPDFFRLGPIQYADSLGNLHIEARDWQIANDANEKPAFTNPAVGGDWLLNGSTFFATGNNATNWVESASDSKGNTYALAGGAVYKWDGFIWTAVSTGITCGHYSAMEINPITDLPWLSCTVGFGGAVRVFAYSGTGTTWNLVSGADVDPTGSYTGLDFNSSGDAYVGYADVNGGSFFPSVKRFNGTNWVFVGSQFFVAKNASYLRLKINPITNEPYVFFQDNDTFHENVYRFNGTSWVQVGAVNFAGEQLFWGDLHFTNDGAPWVIAQDNGGSGAVVYRFNGTTWVKIGGAITLNTDDFSINSDSEGNVYVAIVDSIDGDKLYVYRFDGVDWVHFGTQPVSAGSLNSNSEGRNVVLDINAFDEINVIYNQTSDSRVYGKGYYKVTSFVMDENIAPVGTMTATDADVLDTLTFSVAGGNDAALFTIDPSSGELEFLVAPDYENPLDSDGDNFYSVILRVTDNGSPVKYDYRRVHVEILDVYEIIPGPGGMGNSMNLWFKAGEEVFTDAGTTPATTDLETVQQWNDMSEFGTNAVQMAAGLRPTYYSATSVNAINYNPILQFDGADDRLVHDDVNMVTSARPRAIYAVGSVPNVSVTNKVLYAYGNSLAGTNLNLIVNSSQVQATSATASSTLVANAGVPPINNIPFFVGTRIDSSIDASVEGSGLKGATDTSSTINTSTVANNGVIGLFATQTTVGTNSFPGKVAEIVSFNRRLDYAEKQRIDSYFALKYGITLAGLSGDTTHLAQREAGSSTAQVTGGNFGQTFTATENADIAAINILGSASTATTVDVFICNGALTATDCATTPDHTTTGINILTPNFTATPLKLILSSPFSITNGNEYTFVVRVTGAANLTFSLATTNPYAGGVQTTNTFSYPANDLYFELLSLNTPIVGVPDYVASDGTTVMWDANMNPTYNNDIAGIGQDDNSELLQTKSKSQNADGVMIISAPTDMSDLEFLTAGADNLNATPTFTAVEAPSNYGILNRKWMAHETGDVGTVTIGFDVAKVGYDIPAKGIYYLIYDSDLDQDLTDETPIVLNDAGLNGDETAGDNIWSVEGIDLEPGMLFTLGGTFTPISGIVYSDRGVTPITTANLTVRLLKNGVDTGLTDVTDSAGFYEIDMDAAAVAENDILTVFIDNATPNGAAVLKASGPDPHTGVDIYQNFVIVRSETLEDMTNNDLDIGNSGDGDITPLYTNGTTVNFTGGSGAGIFVWPGTTYTPGGTISLQATTGPLYVYGTMDAQAHSIVVGGDFYVDNAATFNHTGTLTMSGSTRNFNQGDDPISSNLVCNGANPGTIINGNNLNVNSMTINTSRFCTLNGYDMTLNTSFSNEGTLRLIGTETINWGGASQDIDSGVWLYYGNGDALADTFTIRDFGATDYFNLIITSVDGMDTYQLGSNLTIAGGLGVTNGTINGNGFDANIATTATMSSTGNLVGGTGNWNIGGNFSITAAGASVTASSGTMTLGSNFAHTNGTFNHNSGTVAFTSNVTHAITGLATSFYNLTVTDAIDNGVNTQITFPTAVTTTIEGTMTFAGTDASDRVLVRSSSPGVAAVINFPTAFNGSGVWLDVRDSTLNVSGSPKTPEVNPGSSIDSGNNLGWFGLGISGTIFSDFGSTNIGANKTVRLLINGVDSGITAETDASGSFTITGATLALGDLMTLYLDDEPENGVIVTTVSDTVAMGGLNIYRDHLVIRSDNGGSLTNAQLSIALMGDTAGGGAEPSANDISSIYTITGGNLTTPSGVSVVVDAFQNYTPGGNLDLGGNFINNGTFLAGQNVNLEGNWVNSALATFTAGSSIVTFDGTAPQTITSNSDAFSSIVIANTVSQITTTDPLTSNNNFTIAGGATFNLAGQNFVSNVGTFSNEGTVVAVGSELITIASGNDINSGTWRFVGNGDSLANVYSLPDFGGTDYFNLLIDPIDPDDQFNMTAATVIAEDFTMTNGIFDTQGFAFVVNGLNTCVMVGGTFNQGAANVFCAGNFNMTGGNWNGGSGALDVDGNFNHSNGTFTSTSGNFNLAGNFARTGGTFTHNSGTVILDGVNQSITGTTTFYSLSKTDTNNGIDAILTIGGGTTQSIAGVLSLNGVDNDDRINIVSLTPGGEAYFDFIGTSTFSTTGFLDITDNHALDNSASQTFPLNPANSVNGGNSAGWFNSFLVEFTNSADNAAESVTSPTFTLTVSGGDSTGYGLQTVQISITGGTATGGGVDYTLANPTTINIPEADYTIPQTIPIGLTLVDDFIMENDETITMSLVNPSASLVIGDANSDTVTQNTNIFTINDNDTAGIVVTVIDDTTSESGETAVVRFSLTSQPTANVVIPLSIDDPTEGTLGGVTQITITPANWNIPNNNAVTITGVDDVIIDGTIAYNLITGDPTSLDPFYDALGSGDVADVPLTNADNDTANVIVTVINPFSTEAGGNAEVRLRLTSQPTADVVIQLSVDDPTEGSLGGVTQITITPANWNIPSNNVIIISGVDDALLDGPVNYNLVYGEITSIDTDYDALVSGHIPSTTLTNIDDDSTDGDGDGIDDAIEDLAINSGDGNGDGILDKYQANVTTNINPVTGATTTLQTDSVGCNVINGYFIKAESSNAMQDDTREYPVGLNSFEIACSAVGETANLKVFYTQVYDTSNWGHVKYYDTTGQYSDMSSEVTFATELVGSVEVTTLSFAITDGGIYDVDGSANGRIIDPSGPAIMNLATTGEDLFNLIKIIFALVAVNIVSGIALTGYLRTKSYYEKNAEENS